MPGRYTAVVDGVDAPMILEADGTGSLHVQSGQWTITLGQLMLSDGQQWFPATLGV